MEAWSLSTSAHREQEVDIPEYLRVDIIRQMWGASKRLHYHTIPRPHRSGPSYWLKSAEFLKFDSQEYNPSITEELLHRALKYASSITKVTEQDKEIVKLSKETSLFNDGKVRCQIWYGDETPGWSRERWNFWIESYRKDQRNDPVKNLGLYRDDGLAIPNKRTARNWAKSEKSCKNYSKMQE